MTEKQKRFADEYIIDLNATRAYRVVYKNIKSDETARANGSRLLTNANVRAYIDEQLAKIHNEKTADAQEVLEYLTSVMRGEHTEQTLQLVGEGVQKIADIDVSAKERLKAAELIGKRYGMFKDNVNVDGVAKIVFEEDLNEWQKNFSSKCSWQGL